MANVYDCTKQKKCNEDLWYFYTTKNLSKMEQVNKNE